MSRYRVVVVAEARVQFKQILLWWRKNRPVNPKLFAHEVADVLAILAQRPEAGPLAEDAGTDARKILLPRTQYYAYYRVSHAERIVRILSFGHTARRRPPRV